MYLTLFDDWEKFPPLLWLDSMLHEVKGRKSGNSAKKMPFKDTFESLATGREFLASTMPPLMPSPMKLKTNNVMVETFQIQVFNRACGGI